jgi:hypothetical protein
MADRELTGAAEIHSRGKAQRREHAPAEVGLIAEQRPGRCVLDDEIARITGQREGVGARNVGGVVADRIILAEERGRAAASKQAIRPALFGGGTAAGAARRQAACNADKRVGIADIGSDAGAGRNHACIADPRQEKGGSGDRFDDVIFHNLIPDRLAV